MKTKIKIVFLITVLLNSPLLNCLSIALTEEGHTNKLTTMYKFLALSPKNSIGFTKESLELVKHLSMNPDENNKTVLHYAIENRNPAAVRILLKLGFDQNFPPRNRPLVQAIWQRTHDQHKEDAIADNEIINALLSSGALVEAQSLILSVKSGLTYLTNLLLSKIGSGAVINETLNYRRDNALKVAIINRDQEHVKLLLKAGAEIKRDHLIESVSRQFHDITRILLLKRLPVDVINNTTDSNSFYASSPLSNAAENNDYDHIVMLLEAGAFVDAGTVYHAITKKNYKITKKLLEKSPNHEILKRALQYAVANNDRQHIQMLLDAGADHTKDSYLWTKIIEDGKLESAILLLNRCAPSSELLCQQMRIEEFAKRHNHEISTLINARNLIDKVAQQNQNNLLRVTYSSNTPGSPIPKYPKEIIGYIARYLRTPTQEWQHFIAQTPQNRNALINDYNRSLKLTFMQKLKSFWLNFWNNHLRRHEHSLCRIAHALRSRVQSFLFGQHERYPHSHR